MTRTIADLLFRPRGIVVVGASSDPAKLSGRPLDYLKKFGYGGELFAVNPNRSEVQGVPSYATVAKVPGTVDLAVIVVPAAAVVDAVRACGEAGIGAATIFASGFAEVGVEGEPAQAALAAAAAATGIRILGPNCLGSFASSTNAFATFSTAFDDIGGAPDSPIAIVSQSGAVGTFTYSSMSATGIGVRYYANPGNSVDVNVVELLRALVDAEDVEILMGHLEDGQDVAAVEDLASAAHAAGKPLLVLKGGRTASGARAINRHTGSAAGDDGTLTAALGRHGGVRVNSMEAWADAALAFAQRRTLRGPRITFVTQSGGAGAIASDHAVDQGLKVDTWSSDSERAELMRDLPSFASVDNPIDLTGAMINDVQLLRRSLAIIAANDETDAIVVVLGNTDNGAEAIVDALIEAHRATDKPFLVTWTGGSGRPRQELLKAGVPTYTEPNRAVDAVAALASFAQVR